MGLRLGRNAGHRPQAYFQDYGLYKNVLTTNLLATTPDYVTSQGYLHGRGDAQLFRHARDVFLRLLQPGHQRQIPVIHPVIDHDYTFNKPVLGGELSLRSNLTSLTRDIGGLRSDQRQRRPTTACARSPAPIRPSRRSTTACCAACPAPIRACRRKRAGGARSSTATDRCSRHSRRRGSTSPTSDIIRDAGVSNFMNTGRPKWRG